MSSFYIDQIADGTYRYTLSDERGRVMLRGPEGYPDRTTCEMSIPAVRKSASEWVHFVLRGSAGRYSFLLKGPHGVTLGVSGNYANTNARKKHLLAVQRTALVAGIVHRSIERKEAFDLRGSALAG